MAKAGGAFFVGFLTKRHCGRSAALRWKPKPFMTFAIFFHNSCQAARTNSYNAFLRGRQYPSVAKACRMTSFKYVRKRGLSLIHHASIQTNKGSQ